MTRAQDVIAAANALIAAIAKEQDWGDANMDPDNFGCACHDYDTDDDPPTDTRPCSSCCARSVKRNAMALRDLLTLPPEAAAPGAKPLWRKCDSCDGKGGFDLDDVCPTCAWAKYLCGVDQTDCRDPWHKSHTTPVPPPREGG